MCCSLKDDIYTNSMRMGNLTAPNSLPELADHLCPDLVTSRPWHGGLVEAQHNTSADCVISSADLCVLCIGPVYRLVPVCRPQLLEDIRCYMS